MKQIPIYPNPTQLKGYMDGSITAFSVPIEWSDDMPYPAGHELDSVSIPVPIIKYPVGTILVCREPWRVVDWCPAPCHVSVQYKDDSISQKFVDGNFVCGDSWQPANHMPYALSRCKLEATGNKVEKLQDRCPLCNVKGWVIKDSKNNHFICRMCKTTFTRSSESNPWVERPTVRRDKS